MPIRPALMPAGINASGLNLPGLAPLLREDGTACAPALWELLESLHPNDLTDEQALDACALWQRLEGALAARKWSAMDSFVNRPYAGTTGRREFGDDELATAMGVTSMSVSRQTAAASMIGRSLPLTRRALLSGSIDTARAHAMTQECAGLDRATCAVVEHAIVNDRKAWDRNASRLRPRIKKAVLAADPVAAEVRSLEVVQERRVVGSPMPDGMGELWALVPAADMVTITTAISQAAISAKSAGDLRTMDQLKADALVAPFRAALVEGVIQGFEHRLAHHDGAAARVRLTVSGDPTESTATLHGYGPIPASTARVLAQQPHVAIELARQESSAPAPSQGYRPTRELKRFVEHRDVTCRFPGCGRQAIDCDLDHTIAYPTGRTSADNLGALCRRHHRMKHEVPGISLEQDDGQFTWTMPSGQRHTVEPHAPPF